MAMFASVIIFDNFDFQKHNDVQNELFEIKRRSSDLQVKVYIIVQFTILENVVPSSRRHNHCHRKYNMVAVP